MADVPAWIRADNRKTGNSLQGPSSMNAKITGNGIPSMNSKIARPTVKNYADGGMATKSITSPTDGWAAHGSRVFNKANGGMVKAYADGTASDGEWARYENYGDGTSPDERVAMARDPSLPAAPQKDTTGDMGEFNGIDAAMERNKADDAVRAAAPAKTSFKDAFRNAKDGSVFEWEGKKYKKEYADKPAPKAAPKVEPKAESKPAPAPEPKEASREAKKDDDKPMTRRDVDNVLRRGQPGIYTGTEEQWATYRMRQKAAKGGQSDAETERLVRQNQAAKPTPRGRGRIDTDNVDPKTLLPRR